MRGALFVVLVVMGVPLAAAVASGDRGDAPPTLTLRAPGATTFGHGIDFAGLLTPATPNARVHLYRGRTLVADGVTGPGGGFRIHVQVERPGPFHAEAAGVSSPDVVVRIVPFLTTRLVGPMMAGSPLKLEAQLTPSYAGSLRIHVQRPSGKAFDQSFGPAVEVSLGTTAVESFQVTVTDVPRPGFATVTRTLPVALRPPLLEVGAKSPVIEQMLRRLRDLHYAVPAIQEEFDYDVIESVYAFEKVQRLDRTGIVDATFWSRLENATVPQPRYRQPADHIEIDKTRQVLFIVRGGQVTLISPVSTAGIAGYYTPEGRFAIYRKVPGFDPSPLGILYKPMYFTGGYAIHGNPSVPPYPASHGCVRVPNFVIEHLYDSEPYGETVYVY